MRFFIVASLFLIQCFLNQMAIAADPIFQNGGLAIGGYDVVSYHRMQQPVAGLAELEYEWDSVRWRFATETNLKLFKEDPPRYLPRFGGYGAYAVSKGVISPSVPDAWVIYHGKLYLNFSQSVHQKWLAEIDAHILSADKYWPGLIAQEPIPDS